MKMKKLTEVYMNEAIDKNISIIKNEELNCYITFKHIIKASNCCINYINGNDVIIIEVDIVNFNKEIYNIKLVDEDDLKEAFNNKIITDKQFSFAYEVANSLIKELINKNNIFVNRKNIDYLYFIKNSNN